MKSLRITIKRILLFLIGLVLLGGLFGLSPVWSMTMQSGEEIVIGANEVIEDDLYLAGNQIMINGTVNGDVVGAGRQITVNGTVTGDLIAAGQVVVINGTVQDDVRMAGQVLQLGTEAEIADDVVAAGFSLEIKPGSTIGGSLAYGGAQALLAGTVAERMTGGMAALELSGTVGGDVQVSVGDGSFNPTFVRQTPVPIPEVPGGLTVTDSAQIEGQLRYQSPTDADISPQATIVEGISRQEIETAPPPTLTARIWNRVQRWLALLLVGLLLFAIVPNWTNQLVHAIASKPLASAGWGILVVVSVGVLAIAIPVVSLILMFVLGWIIQELVPLVLGLGLLTYTVLVASFWLFVIYVPQVVISLLGGRWVLRVSRIETKGQILPLGMGLLIFVILTTIPVFGTLVSAIAVLLGLGAVGIWGRTQLFSNQ